MVNDIVSSNLSINSSYENYSQESEASLNKLESMSIQSKGLSHQFIKEFFKLNERNFEALKESNSSRIKSLATKVIELSNKKITYYKSSKFGFITEFFSKLRNLVTLRQFISSGELGKQLAEQTLNKLKENSLYATNPNIFQEEAVNTTNEAPIQEQIVGTDFNKKDKYFDTVETLSEESQQFIDNLNGNHLIPQNDVNSLAIADENLLTDPESIAESEDINEGDDFSDIDEDEYFDASEEVLEAKFPESSSIRANSEESTTNLEFNKANTAEVTPTSESAELPKPTYRQEMLETFVNIWEHASSEQKARVGTMGNTVFGKAPIEKWEKTGKGFQLILKKEMIGESDSVPGKAVMKKAMIIQLIEEKKAKSDDYIQKIIFPDKGLVQRVTKGLFSTDINIYSIAFDNDQVTIEAGKGLYTKQTIPFQEGLEFWQAVTWK